jgi:hypothetical protein
MCNTLNELYDEMELWQWNAVQHNRWARALKASNQVGVRPMSFIDELGDGEKKLSWATATRSLRKLKARIIKVGGKREQPKEQAWKLEDAAQWEHLFRGEEVFWKVAGAIRKAGYDSIFSLTQDTAEGGSPAPLLTREGGLGNRGTKHLRLLIPKGITGITENDRATLQAWLELVDWTGLGVLPNSQVPRKLKLNIDSASELHQWLTLKELQCGVRNQKAAQMFADHQKELRMLAEAIRNQDPNAESRVELMSGGEVLGTALITWLKNAEDKIEVARRVVKAVWPRVGTKRSQTHPEWVASCDTKMDLVTEIESWMRTYSARCERQLIKLEYVFPECQHGLCTVCNDIASRTQFPWCMEPIPRTFRTKQLSWNTMSHALGEQWIEEVTDVDTVQTTPEKCLEGEHLKFKAHIRGWKVVTRERRCQSLLAKTEHNLRKVLLSTPWKDVLLVPQAWYPEHTPKFETKGWWYVPAEAVLGRTCKSCNAFCELKEFSGKKRQKTVPAMLQM